MKKNNTLLGAIESISSTALLGITGAIAFNKLGGSKFLADNVPKAEKFLSEVANDLADMRLADFTYDNMKNLYDNHISNNNSTLKTVFKESPTHTLKTTGDNLISAIVRYNEIKASPEETQRKLFKDNYIERVAKELNDKYSKGNKDLEDQINLFTKRVIDRDSLIDIDDDNGIIINKDYVGQYVDLDKIDDTESFFDDLINRANNEAIRGEFKDFKASHGQELISNILNEFSSENIEHAYGTPESFTNLLNSLESADKPMTVNEFLERQDEFQDQFLAIGNEKLSLKKMIANFANEKDIGNVVLDYRNLKINANNEIVDLTRTNELVNNAKRSIAGTIPGKILKISDNLNKEAGPFNLLRKGTSSLLLTGIDNNERYLKNSYAQILSNLYRVNEDNSLTKMNDFGDMQYLLSYHGSEQRLLKNMFGLNSEKEVTNKYLKKFDLGIANHKGLLEDLSEEDTILGKAVRKLAVPKEQYNIVEKILKDSENITKENAIEYRKNLEKLSDIYSSVTNVPNTSTIKKLRDNVRNKESQKILDLILKENDEDIVNELLSNKKEIMNRDLYSLVNLKRIDRNRAARILSIRDDKLTNSKTVFTFSDLLKREAVKEALLNESKKEGSNVTNYNRILGTLNRIESKNFNIDNLKNLAHWSMLQYEGELFNSNKGNKILDLMVESNERIAELLTSKRGKSYGGKDTSFVVDFQNNIKNLQKNYKSLTTAYKNNTTENFIRNVPLVEHGEVIPIRKKYTAANYALDIINDLNDKTKVKANTKRFGMQFIAGKNNPQYITQSTLAPYFFVDRLMAPFNEIGLGLSSKSTGSTLNYASSILLKRVAPIALGITAYQYLDFETKNLTGTSITGALAQGIANVDLGLRKIADKTGLGRVLKTERKLNPLTQYWLGEEYQNAEERKEYYENGYTPVRKGRFWSFGSASEFRGGKINYFQPNLVKRINSDWRNEGLYGGANEKWKHSIIPTPRHPLSTLRYLADPYWLEKKHYNDRPYMQTAPLFSAGTPWGAILNPTIGREFKPVKQMHRLETKRGLIDPRTLIAQRNEKIKARANKKNNLIKVSDTGISNVEYTPYALSDENKAVINFKVGRGRIQTVDYNGVGYTENVPRAKDIEYGSNNYINVESSNTVFNTNYNTNSNSTKGIFNLFDFLETTKIGSQISNSIGSIGFSHISDINDSIKTRANTKDGTMIDKNNLATIPSSIASQMITTRQDEADLLLSTSRYDYISDMLFSGKQISGIYGFILGQFSKKGRVVQRENANNMVSFTRAFWDSNVGGLGGGVMEIARRFFPHENRAITQINNIRNTMPDWLPERFKVGDPYTKVPKGEMRLPGRGYESINKLHPDAYGRYGSLDRMKILADIAPWSEEYKLWRDVAKKTIKDEKGKKEINDILNRVQKQSSAHEFYDYKFLKNPTKVEATKVTAVDNSKIYTKSGKTFNLAGITLKDKKALLNYVQPGATISAEYLKRDKDEDTIDAAIYVDGTNINKTLLNSKQAMQKDKLDAIGAKALTGQLGQFYGAVMEGITHAPIPFIHNKLMRIDTPLESYKNEQVYGTSYSTWDHPIKGFLKPSLQKAWGRDFASQSLALGGWILAEKIWNNPEVFKKTASFITGKEIADTTANKAASIIMNTLNPGAFVGSMLGALPTGLMGQGGIKELLSLDVFGAGVKSGAGRNFARMGATIGLTGYALSRANNPIKSTALFSMAGVALSNQLKKDGFGNKEGAILGAALGLGISAIKNPDFDKNRMFGKWIPKDTKKRREVEEYYDRLEYIKYSGLYKKAARKARLLEGVNVEKLFNSIEANKKRSEKINKKLNKRLEKIYNSDLEGNRKSELIKEITDKKSSVKQQEIIMKGGKYTKAAVAYKQAMDSTIYGLNKNSTMQQVLRAVPKSDKDYFLQFMQEKDKRKRKKILKYISPYERKALQIAWGYDDIDKPESNRSFFRTHKLPGVFWSGWTPQVDLEKVKIKTIENEGMLLSDFGIYDSQANEPSTIMAPEIDDIHNSGDTITLQSRLTSALNGAGLIGVKVTVEPSQGRGIQVISNITNSLKITEYNIQKEINKFTGARLFY